MRKWNDRPAAAQMAAMNHGLSGQSSAFLSWRKVIDQSPRSPSLVALERSTSAALPRWPRPIAPSAELEPGLDFAGKPPDGPHAKHRGKSVADVMPAELDRSDADE